MLKTKHHYPTINNINITDENHDDVVIDTAKKPPPLMSSQHQLGLPESNAKDQEKLVKVQRNYFSTIDLVQNNKENRKSIQLLNNSRELSLETMHNSLQQSQ